MFMSNAIISLSFFLHLLATVVWIGGLVTLVFLVQPLAGRLVADAQTRARLLDGLQKRFQPLANLSLIVLLLTGMVQLVNNRFYKGFLQFDNVWSQVILIKHLGVIGMIGLAAYLTFSLQPALRRLALLATNGVDNPAEAARLQRQQTRLTRLSLILMTLILICTAIASAQP